MSVTTDLYKRAIFDHNRNPRNFRAMDDASQSCEGYNPLCGDKVNVFLKMNEAGTIEDVSFTGSGCAIFKASASFMTTALKGKTTAEAKTVLAGFVRMVKGEDGGDGQATALGKLEIFQGVREFPSRVKCATLAWHAADCALDKKKEFAENETGQEG